MMELLKNKHCVPCEIDVRPLNTDEARSYLQSLVGWTLAADGACIAKKYTFKKFPDAIVFMNEVFRLAEEEGHHPDLKNSYTNVEISLATHNIKGLSINDFILAAKIDEIQ